MTWDRGQSRLGFKIPLKITWGSLKFVGKWGIEGAKGIKKLVVRRRVRREVLSGEAKEPSSGS